MRHNNFRNRKEHNYNFNPRTREGCDKRCTIALPIYFYFNPRTREGCDCTVTIIYYQFRKFQSTHPRRVRLFCRELSAATGNFNPRTREGCDGCTSVGCNRSFLISIHAPAKGATQQKFIDEYIISDFNPRTREGCDVISWTGKLDNC